MVLTPSTMKQLGSNAPTFTLPDPQTQEMVSFDDVTGEKGTVVLFICNHCPFVKHVKNELIRLHQDYSSSFGFVAINSNDVENYPDDSPEKMIEEKYPFPYLYDETQEVARAYDAACTPDIFVYDSNKTLVYRGRIDASTPSNGKPVTGEDLRNALDALKAGKNVSKDQQPSFGCNIKWKK